MHHWERFIIETNQEKANMIFVKKNDRFANYDCKLICQCNK